ncbi:MAG: hypothetical protein JWS10_2330 [Cypionkella sp.]|nr:hypothetical protein [Cypionkella sp.]
MLSFCACIVAGKEGVLAVEGDGADRALDGVAVELDAAICQETAQAIAVFRDIGQCLTEGRFGGSVGAVMAQPIIKACKDRDGTFFARGQAGSMVIATYVSLDGVEIADECYTLFGNWRRTGSGDLDQFMAGVGPAIGQLNAGAYPIRCDQAVISGIAVHLQDATKALQYPFGMQPASTGCIGEGHGRRCFAAPRSLMACKCPEVSSFGLLGPRIENRCAGLICYPLGDCAAIGREGMKSFVDRFRSAIRAWKTGRNSKAARPTSPQGLICQIDTLTVINLRLTIQGQMVGIFADQNMRDSRLCRHATRDQSCRSRSLNHTIGAGPTCIVRAAGDDHAELGGDDV